MALKHALLCALSLATATPNSTDLAALLAISSNAAVVPTTPTQVLLSCGDEASLSIEFNCNDLGAHSICIPKNSTATASRVRRVRRSSPSNSKRDGGAKCDSYSGQCRNQYQSSSGYCSDGYEKEHFGVSGYTQDTWCVKPCTEKEASACHTSVCNRVRPQCEGRYTSSDTCMEALVECRGNPVKVKQEWCKPEFFGFYGGSIFGGTFDDFCKQQKSNCLEYANGACRLDKPSWDNYVAMARNAQSAAADAYVRGSRS